MGSEIDLVVLPNEIRETARLTSGEAEWPKDNAAAATAMALLDAKATAEEVADYKKFAVAVATRAAQAHEEKGSDDPISEAEQAALASISDALA